MKKILLITALLLSAFYYKAEAQVDVNINIGQQPTWGPVGYDYANYYYLPDLGVYYDVPRGLFVYFNYGRWNFAPGLPASFGQYDLYHSYKVVVNDRNPWLRNDYYFSHYSSYRGHYQPLIRDSHDNRYFAGRERYDYRRSDMRTQTRTDQYTRHDNGVRDYGRGQERNDHGHGRDHDRW
ncbi:MAG: hypothetical protein ABI261_07035 [Ginsengibacter sp.]